MIRRSNNSPCGTFALVTAHTAALAAVGQNKVVRAAHLHPSSVYQDTEDAKAKLHARNNPTAKRKMHNKRSRRQYACMHEGTRALGQRHHQS